MNDSHTVDIEKFADLVIEKWQTKIVVLGITDTRTLFNSFMATVTREANGDPKKITFVFEYYGKFLDMGVFGTGSRARQKRGTMRRIREKYPWYSSVFARQVRRLANLMARQYGYDSVTTVVESVKK
jgi:hypothetical protein